MKSWPIDLNVIAAATGLSLQAWLNAANGIVGLAVGLATFLYIRRKTAILERIRSVEDQVKQDETA